MIEIKERSAPKKEAVTIQTLTLGSIVAITLLALLLWFAVVSIGRVDGRIKTAPSAPDSLVSVGAPRSQLSLKRMFSLMSDSYEIEGKTVYEPITSLYRRSVEERIQNGEDVSLSVEEVLYIISDTSAAYDSYDTILLMSSNGSVEKTIVPRGELASCDIPYHIAAQQRINDIIEIIEYRLSALSSEDAIDSGEGRFAYIPNYLERKEGFGFFEISDGQIAFRPDSTRTVMLYPSASEYNDANAKVIFESKRKATFDEEYALSNGGYEPENCRNITPEYWYLSTDLRLFVSGGRIILVDGKNCTARDTLPDNMRFTSFALNGDTVYFTSSLLSDNGSALWRYTKDNGIELIYESKERYIGIFETETGVSLYKTNKEESKTYMTRLIRTGNALWSDGTEK